MRGSRKILTDFVNKRGGRKLLERSGGCTTVKFFWFQPPKVTFPGFLSHSDRILARFKIEFFFHEKSDRFS